MEPEMKLTAHENKMAELDFLLAQKIKAEMENPKKGCFGSLMYLNDSKICGACEHNSECKIAASDGRTELIAELNLKCEAMEPVKKVKKTKAKKSKVIEALAEVVHEEKPEVEDDYPLKSEEIVDEVKPELPKRSKIDWDSIIAVVYAKKPDGYINFATCIADELKAQGAKPWNYTMFKRIADMLVANGILSFDDYKAKHYMWLK